MESNINYFFQEIEDIAAILGDENFKQIIGDIKGNITSPKLRILIAGNNTSGRFSVVNGMTGLTQLLPVSPLPKTNALVKVVYGDPYVEAISHDDVKIAIPEKMSKQILLDSDDSDNSNRFKHITICAKSDLLKTCDLTIYSIEAQYSEEQLKNLFSNTDYILLVTNATAFVSLKEREFISKALNPHFGFERVAVLINKIDLVKESERLSIMELAKKYFGSLKTQPLILFYSAETTSHDISGSEDPLIGENIPLNTIKNTLIGNPYVLKSRAIRQAAHFCIDEISRIIDRQKSSFSLTNTECAKLSETLNVQNSVLQEKIHRSRQRVSLSINGLLKERHLCEVDDFASCLRENLPAEIKSVDELSSVKRYLPGYLEQLWSDFFDYNLPLVREKIHLEMVEIQRQVVNDIREVSGDLLDKYPELLETTYFRPMNVNPWLKHGKSKNELSKAANVVQTGGFMILPILSLPLGVAMIGAGQVIRIIGQNSIRTDEQRALIETAINSELELELMIQKQVSSQFEDITHQLMDFIKNLYEDNVNQIQAQLVESQQTRRNLEEREVLLSEIQDKKVPRLQELISGIDSEYGVI